MPLSAAFGPAMRRSEIRNLPFALKVKYRPSPKFSKRCCVSNLPMLSVIVKSCARPARSQSRKYNASCRGTPDAIDTSKLNSFGSYHADAMRAPLPAYVLMARRSAELSVQSQLGPAVFISASDGSVAAQFATIFPLDPYLPCQSPCVAVSASINETVVSVLLTAGVEKKMPFTQTLYLNSNSDLMRTSTKFRTSIVMYFPAW